MRTFEKFAVRLFIALLAVFVGWRLVDLCLAMASEDRYSVLIDTFGGSDSYPLVIEYHQGPQIETIYYFSPEEGSILQEEVEVEILSDRAFPESLFLCWRERSGLPEAVSLLSCDAVFGHEVSSEISGSAILGFVPEPPRITMDIGGELRQHLDPEGLVLDSLARTVLGAYEEGAALVISVDGDVVYGGEDAG